MGKFYITTPIFYVNDKPHIGHAYTVIIADVLARWHRLSGDEVFFLTGTDEHGEKIQRAAEAKGVKPNEFVDRIVKEYKAVWNKLNISYDRFIRTTDSDHKETVDKFIEKIYENGDIYKGEYEGWYCVPDETFLTDSQLINGKCPACGREVKKVKEEAYFFRLSKYKDRLLEFYGKNPGFIVPEFRMTEMKNRLKGDVRDLDITRKSISWAIPFKPDMTHSVYVWVDALVNYISALRWPNGGLFKEFWPADIHVIGKEINWFHSVIWPSLLMSAGLELPKTIMVHGWLTVEGQKMSKSLRNVVDPAQISDRYSADALRYFLIRSVKLGEDSDFSEKELISKINGELVSNIGNLLSRTVSLYRRVRGKVKGEAEIKLDTKRICRFMDDSMIHEALDAIVGSAKDMNRYIAEKEPWKLEAGELKAVLYNLLEGLRILSILIYPFMPDTALEMCRQLRVNLGTRDDLKFKEVDYRPRPGKHLFRWVR